MWNWYSWMCVYREIQWGFHEITQTPSAKHMRTNIIKGRYSLTLSNYWTQGKHNKHIIYNACLGEMVDWLHYIAPSAFNKSIQQKQWFRHDICKCKNEGGIMWLKRLYFNIIYIIHFVYVDGVRFNYTISIEMRITLKSVFLWFNATHLGTLRQNANMPDSLYLLWRSFLYVKAFYVRWENEFYTCLQSHIWKIKTISIRTHHYSQYI